MASHGRLEPSVLKELSILRSVVDLKWAWVGASTFAEHVPALQGARDQSTASEKAASSLTSFCLSAFTAT